MAKRLLLLGFIWLILTAIIVYATYLFYPGWELLPLIVATCLIVIAILDQVSGALGLIDRILDEFGNVGIEKRYRELQLELNRSLDVRDLLTQGTVSLDLKRVYVELSVDFAKLHEVSKDLVPVIDEYDLDSLTFWDLLRLEEISNLNLVFLGPPGSGKTTLLRHISFVLADKSKPRKSNVPNLLPIVLNIRDHSRKIKSSWETGEAYTLIDTLVHMFGHHDFQLPKNWLRKGLKKGKFLVLIDGLDEIAESEERRLVTAWIEHQFSAFSESRFVVTSRPHGYQSNTLSRVAIFEVRPFDFKQIERFVLNWYSAITVLDKNKSSEENAKDLLTQLRSSPSLSQLAINPLLLTMITAIHALRKSLPEGRVNLYAEIFEVFLVRRQLTKGIQNKIELSMALDVLKALACTMMIRRQNEMDYKDFETALNPTIDEPKTNTSMLAMLRAVERASGLLIEQKQEQFRFAHRTFQEYLTAVNIAEGNTNIDLLNHVTDEWWYETVRFYASISNATPIVRACLSQSHSIVALALAIDCVEDGAKVSTGVKTQLEELLKKGLESNDLYRRHLATEVKLSRRLRNFTQVNRTIAIDPFRVSVAEYQLFLDEMYPRRVFRQPDHWTALQFSLGAAQDPIVGVRASDAKEFSIWLGRRRSMLDTYRIPVTSEVDSLLDSSSRGDGYWVLQDSSVAVETNDKNLNQGISLYKATLKKSVYRDVSYNSSNVLVSKLTKYESNARIDVEPIVMSTIERVFSRSLGLNISNASRRASDLFVDETSLQIDRYFLSELILSVSRAFGFNHSISGILEQVIQTVVRQDHALQIGLQFILERDHEKALRDALNRIRGLAIYNSFNRFLAGNRTRARDFAHNLELDSLRSLVFEFLRFYTVTAAAAIEQIIVQNRKANWANQSSVMSSNLLSRLRDGYAELYVILVILDERTKGHLPAYEGIRLVREQKTPVLAT